MSHVPGHEPDTRYEVCPLCHSGPPEQGGKGQLRNGSTHDPECPFHQAWLARGGFEQAVSLGHEATTVEAARIDVFKEGRYGYIVGIYSIGVASPRTGGIGWFALVVRSRPDGKFGGMAIHPASPGLGRKLYEWYGPRVGLSSPDVVKHAHTFESWWLAGFFSDLRVEPQATIMARNARRSLRDAMRFEGWPPYEKIG